MINTIEIFQRLPYPLKVIAASLKGSYLQRLRYGDDLEHQVLQALDRETWDADKWEAWRGERLSLVLDRAATKVPYYQKFWQ